LGGRKINVLVGTTVLEEGIDVPHVRFDPLYFTEQRVVSGFSERSSPCGESYVMDTSKSVRLILRSKGGGTFVTRTKFNVLLLTQRADFDELYLFLSIDSDFTTGFVLCEK
jgi:hypothetical protein